MSVEDLLRELAPQVLGGLVRRYGVFDSCEDAVPEALIAAALQWLDAGVPDNSRGWLTTVASRKLVDQMSAVIGLDLRKRGCGAVSGGWFTSLGVLAVVGLCQGEC